MRRHDCWLKWKLDTGNQRLLNHSLLLGKYVSLTIPHSHSRTCFRDSGFERALMVSCWDHLDWICDWTQLRSLCKLSGFWWVAAEIYASSNCPRQALYVGSFAYSTCYLPLWSDLLLSLVSPFSLCMEASFRLHPGNSCDFKPTTKKDITTWRRGHRADY